MAKKYGFTYAGSGLCATAPMSEKEMIERVERTTNCSGAIRERYKIYELVPVKFVTKEVTTRVTTLERIKD